CTHPLPREVAEHREVRHEQKHQENQPARPESVIEQEAHNEHSCPLHSQPDGSFSRHERTIIRRAIPTNLCCSCCERRGTGLPQHSPLAPSPAIFTDQAPPGRIS